MSVINKLLDLLLPRRCVVCNECLNADERCLCTSCQAFLPRLSFDDLSDNDLVRLFWCELTFVRAFALMRYNPASRYHNIIEVMKYKGRPDVCVAMGTLLAESVGSADFFADIDAIVPVPLSRKRLRQRGYNQAEQIAKGIGKATGIRVFPDVLRRKVDNATQTRLNSDMRMVNVHDIFEVVRTNGFKARHILLVDDVVTTGATLLSMARTLAASFPGVRFSVACVGHTVRQ